MMEEWEKKLAKESAERDAKARKLLPRYQNDPTKILLKDELAEYQSRDVEFQDWVKETPDEVRTKTTLFRIPKRGQWNVWSSTSVSQKFLVANGPRAGQKILPDKDHVPFNCAGWNRGSYKEKDDPMPRVVLVHKSAWGE